MGKLHNFPKVTSLVIIDPGLKSRGQGLSHGLYLLQKGSANQIYSQTLAHCLFLYHLWAKNDFYIFKQLGGKDKRIFSDIWELHEIPIPVSINKIVLEYSHTHSFVYCLWLLSQYTSRVEYLRQRPYGQKTKILLSDPLQEKFANPYTVLLSTVRVLSTTNY